MRTFLTGVLFCGVMFGSLAFAGVNMQAGNWETTVEMKMEGMPFPMPPTTYKMTQCLTQKDMVPNTSTRDRKCEIRDQKIIGNKVTWKMICVDGQGRSEGDGEITYSGSSFKGVIRTKMMTKDPSETMRSIMNMTGKRLGNCPK